MVERLCLLEEHSRNAERSSNDDLLQITYRPYEPQDYPHVCSLYWEFFLLTLRQDLSGEITLDDGLKIFEVETHVNQYLAKGCEIILAFHVNDPVGLFIYHRVYPELVCAWVGYVKPEYENRRIGINILKSINPRPKKFIFQTLNENSSDRMLQITEGERILLHEDPIHTTWMVQLKE